MLNARAINWYKFRSMLDSYQFYETPDKIGSAWLDEEALFLSDKIMEVAEASSKKIESKPKIPKPVFWSAEIDDLKRQSRRLYRLAVHRKVDSYWEQFRAKRKVERRRE